MTVERPGSCPPRHFVCAGLQGLFIGTQGLNKLNRPETRQKWKNVQKPNSDLESFFARYPVPWKELDKAFATTPSRNQQNDNNSVA